MMQRNFFPSTKSGAGFTLIELLVVTSIISVLLALVVPAFTSVNTGRQMKWSAYGVESALETARAYAKANNTYTWVGFYEEDASKASTSPATAGTGRVIVSVVASKDGTSMYPVNGDQTALTATNLVQVGKLVKLDNAHLDMLAQNDVPSRTEVTDPTYQVGNSGFDSHGGAGANKVTFNYPISGTSAYTFVKVIQFNPLGDAAKIVDSPTPLIELDLRPAHGPTVDVASRNCVALQVTGIGGAVRLYQP